MSQAKREPEVKKIDSLGRINLGRKFAHEQFSVVQDEFGTFILTPVAVIPKRELWLWQNQEAMSAVREGLEQSARGEVEYLGSFAEYAEDEVGD